ncbi:hypothetical protein ACTHGU_10430 [Chitinophagaceae bacterium MMS25-I14]
MCRVSATRVATPATRVATVQRRVATAATQKRQRLFRVAMPATHAATVQRRVATAAIRLCRSHTSLAAYGRHKKRRQ